MTRVAASASILSVILVAGGLHASPAPPPEQAAPTFTRDVAPIIYKAAELPSSRRSRADVAGVTTRTCGRGRRRSNRKSSHARCRRGAPTRARQVQGRPQPHRRADRHDRPLGRRRGAERRRRRFAAAADVRGRLARWHSPTRSSRCRSSSRFPPKAKCRRDRFLHEVAVQRRTST